MSVERWIGGIDAKLQNISDKINKIEVHLEKLNNRTGDAEKDIVILRVKTEKNCKDIKELKERDIKDLEEKIDASHLRLRDKIAIIGIGVAAISGIIIAVFR